MFSEELFEELHYNLRSYQAERSIYFLWAEKINETKYSFTLEDTRFPNRVIKNTMTVLYNPELHQVHSVVSGKYNGRDFSVNERNPKEAGRIAWELYTFLHEEFIRNILSGLDRCFPTSPII